MLSLSKLIETKVGSYIYDALSNKIIPIPTKLSKEIKREIFSKDYFEFIKQNNCRDFTEYTSFNLKNGFHSKETLKWLLENKMNSITLCVTENCNLRCEYCVYMNKYKDSTYKLKDMPQEVAIKAIDMLMKNSKLSGKVDVGFYGGEPLLRFDLIKKCVDYCRKNYPFRIPVFNTTTNGLLLNNEEITDFLIKNNFIILVSLDGPKYSQNAHRLCVSGETSFDTVFENLNKFYMKDPKFFKTNVGISSVRTPLNCNSDQCNFLDSLRKAFVVLADLENTEHFEKILKSKLKHFEVGKNQIDAFKYDFLKLNVLTNMKNYHDNLKYNFNTYDILPGGFCTPGVRKNFITTEGKIVVCEKVDERQPEFILGNIFSGFEVNKIKKLFDISTQKMQKCRNCWAAKLCSFCFKHNLTDKFCKISCDNVYSDLKYYIEEVMDKKEIITFLENMPIGG